MEEIRKSLILTGPQDGITINLDIAPNELQPKKRMVYILARFCVELPVAKARLRTNRWRECQTVAPFSLALILHI